MTTKQLRINMLLTKLHRVITFGASLIGLGILTALFAAVIFCENADFMR